MLPLSERLRCAFGPEQSRRYALSSGDDYELLFTCAARDVNGLQNDLESLGTRCTVIGSMEANPGIRLMGGELSPSNNGWEHFR